MIGYLPILCLYPVRVFTVLHPHCLYLHLEWLCLFIQFEYCVLQSYLNASILLLHLPCLLLVQRFQYMIIPHDICFATALILINNIQLLPILIPIALLVCEELVFLYLLNLLTIIQLLYFNALCLKTFYLWQIVRGRIASLIELLLWFSNGKVILVNLHFAVYSQP